MMYYPVAHFVIVVSAVFGFIVRTNRRTDRRRWTLYSHNFFLYYRSKKSNTQK